MGCDSETMVGHLLPHPPRSTGAQGAQGTCATQGFGGLVQQIVSSVLPTGYPDIQSVATVMGLSARTLQRRLYAEGVTYACVVARARFAAAQQMLDDPARKVIDVALDLGYSDPAHFARAFARWTGLAPRDFRRLRSTGSRGG
jgi:AraC-like DNA-binding protein